MGSLLRDRRNDEDLTVTSSHACCDSTAPSRNFLIARIAWCQQQKLKAPTEAELEAWCAEEEGLWDALLDRDRTYHFQNSPLAVFERYALGLEDARTLIRAAWVGRKLHSGGS